MTRKLISNMPGITKAHFLFISQVMLPCHSHAAVVRFFQNATAATQLDQATGRHTMIHQLTHEKSPFIVVKSPIRSHVNPMYHLVMTNIAIENPPIF